MITLGGAKLTVVRRKGYLVVLSIGERIPIDQDEVKAVLEAVRKPGTLVKVRQGIFDTRFFACIVEDKPRYETFIQDETRHNPERRRLGMAPLPDILGDVVGPKLLEGGK